MEPLTAAIAGFCGGVIALIVSAICRGSSCRNHNLPPAGPPPISQMWPGRCGYRAGSGPSPTRNPAAYPVGPPGAGEPRCRRGVAKRSLVATILEDGTWET